MQIRGILKKILFLFAGITIVTSCKNNQKFNRDHLVFRYNEHANIATLDPVYARNNATIWASNQLFNGLIQLDENLEIHPDIAKSWVINDTTLTYTFTLRNDVYFHKHPLFGKDSTRTVTASDFEYSFNRLKNPKIASPGSWVLQQVDDFYAVNDTVFEIRLKEHFPPFLGLLAMRYCAVVPKEITEYYGGNFRSNPIGTGPFQFKLWEENIKLVFRKNPLYFEKDETGIQLPYLEAIAITFLPDKQSEFLQFAQGNIDFISGLDASYKDELLTSDGKLKDRYSEEVTMLKGAYLNVEYITFQTQKENSAAASENFRKAVNYSIDRNKLITYLRNGIGYPGEHGIIPKGLAGFSHLEGFSYQPSKAQQFLDSFKAETGIQNPKLILTTDANYQDIFEYLQRELEKIGIEVQVDIMPSSAIRQARSNGSLEAFRSSWVADYPDAENYLSLFYSKNHSPNGSNYTFYKNELFDLWYNTSLTISDIEQRKEWYTKMDSLVIQNAPIVPLYYDEAVRFVRKNVSGLGINSQNSLHLKKVKKIKF